MTTKELIAVLEMLPSESEVFMEPENASRSVIGIRSVALDLVHKSSRKQLSDGTTDAREYDSAVIIFWSWHPDDE